MKLLFFTASVVLAASLATSIDAAVIIGVSTGNGDFQATTLYDNSATVPTDNKTTASFDFVSNWVNLGGSETGPNFGANNQLNASPDAAHDPKQGAFLSVGNVAANETGYTITAAGETFDASLFLGGTGGAAGYGDADPNASTNGNMDDETVEVFLFTATSGVDGSTTIADITKLATASFDLDRAVYGIETATSPLYTATAADVGKTLYLGLELLNPTGGNPFPRIDVVTFDVTPVPEPAGFSLLGAGLLTCLVIRRRK